MSDFDGPHQTPQDFDHLDDLRRDFQPPKLPAALETKLRRIQLKGMVMSLGMMVLSAFVFQRIHRGLSGFLTSAHSRILTLILAATYVYYLVIRPRIKYKCKDCLAHSTGSLQQGLRFLSLSWCPMDSTL